MSWVDKNDNIVDDMVATHFELHVFLLVLRLRKKELQKTFVSSQYQNVGDHDVQSYCSQMPSLMML